MRLKPWFALLPIALALPAEASAQARLLQVSYVPTKRAQVAIWIERADGTYLRTLALTEAVGLRGIGNRPGALQMNSGFRWPYGRREGVLPVWAHRRGDAPGAMLFPMVRFQNRVSEGLASRTSEDFSRDDYFCLSFDRNDALDVDAVTCASVFNSDKGAFMVQADLERGYSEPFDVGPNQHSRRPLSLESYYPPRRDTLTRSTYDTADVLRFGDVARAAMPEIDAVTRATAAANTTQALVAVMPPEWPEGDYVLYVEVNTERDHNDTYSVDAYPTPSNGGAVLAWDSWAMTYGYPYRGQPSVVYRVPFRVDTSGGTYFADTAYGYGDLHGLNGDLRPLDETITDDPVGHPGSGVDRLQVDPSGHRVQLYVERCEMPPPVPAVASVEAAPVDDVKHSHEWAHVEFDAIAVGGSAATGYQVKVSTQPILDATAFERAEDAKSTAIDYEGLDLCPFDHVNRVSVCAPPGERVAFDIGKLVFTTRYYVAVRAVGRCGVAGPITSQTFETTAIHFTTVAPCFVATAAHGSPTAEDVTALRTFRDTQLRTTVPGRAFVDAYYAVGPTLARFIAPHPSLRAIARALLEPFVAAVGVHGAPPERDRTH